MRQAVTVVQDHVKACTCVCVCGGGGVLCTAEGRRPGFCCFAKESKNNNTVEISLASGPGAVVMCVPM